MRRLVTSCCLNWKVVTGLALIGLGVWALAPALVGAALPVLLAAICPLSLLVMLIGMGRRRGMSPPRPVSRPHALGLTPADQLAALRAHLATLDAQQAALVRELTQAEALAVSEGQVADTRGGSMSPEGGAHEWRWTCSGCRAGPTGWT